MFSKKLMALAFSVSVMVVGGIQVAAAQETSGNSIVMTSKVDKKEGAGVSTNAFQMGQQVYAYLTLAGKPGEQPKQLEAKWYHCGKLVTSYPYVSTPNKDPHHVWFWINSTEMGAGAGRVDIRSGNSLLARANFEVKAADGSIKACPLPPRNISLSADALFAFGKSGVSDITAQGQNELRNVVSQINEAYSKVNSITVVGYTDSIGNDKANMALSNARANSIRELLVSNGIPAGIIRAEGRGEQNKTGCNEKMPREQLIVCKAPDRSVAIAINGVERQISGDE